jgi:hypothetical protein
MLGCSFEEFEAKVQPIGLDEDQTDALWFEVQYISAIRGEISIPNVGDVANKIKGAKIKPITLGVNTTSNDGLFDDLLAEVND